MEKKEIKWSNRIVMSRKLIGMLEIVNENFKARWKELMKVMKLNIFITLIVCQASAAEIVSDIMT